MIKRHTVYLKNIIFFKVIMASFAILLLSWLMFVFKQDLIYSSNKYNFIYTNTLDIEKKLRVVLSSGNEALNFYKKYEKFLNTSTQENCAKRQKLVTDIKALAAKYNLNEPIDINIIRSFDGDHRDSQTKINNYDCTINFTTPNFVTFINLAKEIYALAPENSFISLVEAKELTTLTPYIVAKLNTTHDTNLITVKLLVRLREINSQ